jgi:hypothetical protein
MYKRLERSDKKIMERWQCTSQNCRNAPNFCYIKGQDHYMIETKDISYWGRQIKALNATFESPPISLYDSWVAKGSVEKNYKQPLVHQRYAEKKEERTDFSAIMSKYIEAQGKMMEMSMAERIMQAQERMQQRQDISQPPPPAYQPPPPPPPPPPQPQALPPPPQRDSTTSELPLRTSSPLVSPDDEETAMETFFQWKEKRTKHEGTKGKIRHAYEVILESMWTFDDLRAMEDTTSTLYTIATAGGIPDGMARGFRRDIRTFKGPWRALGGLQSLQNQQQLPRRRGSFKSDFERDSEHFVTAIY